MPACKITSLASQVDIIQRVAVGQTQTALKDLLKGMSLSFQIYKYKSDCLKTETLKCPHCQKIWTAIYPDLCNQLECPQCHNLVKLFDDILYQ